MKKKNMYEKYFGKNIARIVYLISCGLLIYGCFNVLVGNSYWGAIYCVIGVVPFFFVYHKQVSDKHMDELVDKTKEEYLDKNIKGKTINKQELNPSKFSTFNGFIRDAGNVRFKMCRDGKMRTSKYYVTALSINRDECIVSMSTYDLIKEETRHSEIVIVTPENKVNFAKKEIEFPKGNFECTLTYLLNSEEKEIKFYLPTGDYLAEQLMEKIAAL